MPSAVMAGLPQAAGFGLARWVRRKPGQARIAPRVRGRRFARKHGDVEGGVTDAASSAGGGRGRDGGAGRGRRGGLRVHPGAGRATGRSAGAGRTVLAAYTATNAKTAAFRLDASIEATSSGGSSQSATLTGSGQVDFTAKAFTVSVNAPSGGTIKILLVNGIEYLQVPAAARSQIPGHKPWVSVNLNKVTQARLGASFSQLASAGDDNPAQALSQLQAVSSGVSRAGRAIVAGVPATEYRAQVSLAKVAAAAQAKEGARAAQVIREEIKTLGTATLPVEVWIDARHLVRQIRFQAPIPAASSGGPAGRGTAVLTMTFTSFGAPVRLTPPAASQTADLTNDLLRQAKASFG